MKITKEYIENLMSQSEFQVTKMFDKTTVVACRLPNGFTIVESAGCIDPANYDIDLGVCICKKRIENRLYELEGYKAHQPQEVL
ncbi:Gp49 family protein [Priestia megaterium]|uniref:Gp49 family protein n=1 Tax=Priestia megaterium TaxID=1404 RepID=UPI002E1BD2AC|nr:Gp49 family protein [Priestia megaterium]